MKLPWQDIAYLQAGSSSQRAAYSALTELGILDTLQEYSPVLAGTYPLDLAVSGSDLDILCAAPDLELFTRVLERAYETREGFLIETKILESQPTVICRFLFRGLPVEIFGQTRPVQEQNGYRHLLVEARLLEQAGPAARQAILQLKQDGQKTEPAFAQYFGLHGDPYQVLLAQESS